MSYKDIFIQRHIAYKLERVALAGREKTGAEIKNKRDKINK